jgi:excisionase family DNA binding protein
MTNSSMTDVKAHQASPKLSITVTAAAQATGFSENYLRLLIARHELPHVRVGRAVRLMVSDLERFLLEHRQPA